MFFNILLRNLNFKLFLQKINIKEIQFFIFCFLRQIFFSKIYKLIKKMEGNIEKIEENPEIIIFIIGTSAVGKTKLSLVLGEQLKNCEIINCDSMQLYKNADIMTAKATKEERAKIKHHLFDILELSKKDFTRPDYTEIATNLINSLFKQGKIPIIVGGTHYYIESLLFKDDELFQDLEKEEEKEQQNNNSNKNSAKEEELFDYELLKTIDPLMAEKTHPNDKRRIRNYIKFYNRTKKLPSELFMNCETNKSLRYKNAIVLWPFMQNMEILKEKARVRIDEMVNFDGIEEIINVYEFFCSQIQNINEIDSYIDFQKGVLQAIGYKEFFPFYKEVKRILLKDQISFKQLNQIEKSDFLKSIENNKIVGEVLKKCKEFLLIKTMKYTKKQLVWIENRLSNLKVLENCFFKFEFDCYLGDNFSNKVVSPATQIIADFTKNLNNSQLESKFNEYLAKNKKKNNKKTRIEDWKKHFCEICECELNGPKEWEIHLISRKHSKKKVKLERIKESQNLYENKEKIESPSKKNEEEKENEQDKIYFCDKDVNDYC